MALVYRDGVFLNIRNGSEEVVPVQTHVATYIFVAPVTIVTAITGISGQVIRVLSLWFSTTATQAYVELNSATGGAKWSGYFDSIQSGKEFQFSESGLFESVLSENLRTNLTNGGTLYLNMRYVQYTP